MSASYPTPVYRRTALAPGVLGAIACLAGTAAIGGDLFTLIRFLVSIVGAIVIVFAVQARHWWWAPPLAAIVVLWNPVLPIDPGRDVWMFAHYIAALVFVGAALLIRVRIEPERRAAK